MNDGSSLLHPEPRPSHLRKNFLGLWAPAAAAAAAAAAVPGRASLFLSSPAPLQRLRENVATRLYTLQTESLNIESRLYVYIVYIFILLLAGFNITVINYKCAFLHCLLTIIHWQKSMKNVGVWLHQETICMTPSQNV